MVTVEAAGRGEYVKTGGAGLSYWIQPIMYSNVSLRKYRPSLPWVPFVASDQYVTKVVVGEG